MVNWASRSRMAGNICETVGLTPLVRLNRVVQGLSPRICGKLEYFNPSASLKDRILPHMVAQAEKKGELRPGMTIIEASTGNTGVATAMVGAAKGYRVVIVMPSGMSEERSKVIKAYGAEVIFTPGGESDVDLALAKVQELKEQNPGMMWEVGQFVNQDNVEAHYLSTGPEIWEQTGGQIDIFVASQGSGGTLSGVAKYLKERKPEVLAFAVEPAECPILSRGKWGPHRIEGIGDGFVPQTLAVELLDGVVTTTSEEAIAMAQRLAKEEGIFCGISSGCNVAAAVKVAKKYPKAKLIVTMINDSGERYLSTELCGEPKGFEVPEREHEISQTEKERLARRDLVIIN